MQSGRLFLRVWSPELSRAQGPAVLQVTLKLAGRGLPARVRRGERDPVADSVHCIRLSPEPPLEQEAEQRFYPWPEKLRLQAGKCYRVSGRLCGEGGVLNSELFVFTFYTDLRGVPVVF